MMKQACKAILLAFLGFSGVAQESTAPRVTIPLIAISSRHRPASVTVESPVITDQKTLVSGASLLRGADLPLELGLLIDASSSLRPADLKDILNAAKQFVDESIRGPEDRVFFLQFDGSPHATEWLKKDQLRGAVVPVRVGGGTALYDALATACKERMGPRKWQEPTRRILVLISDGEDNASRITRDEAVLEALRAGAVIFTIDTDVSGMSYKGLKIMQNLAEVTGGESFSQVGWNDGPKVFVRIKDMIDGMYYLRYVPPDASKRTVHEVEVAPKEKVKLSYARRYLWNQ